MTYSSPENRLDLLPAEIEKMFPTSNEVVVFSHSVHPPTDLLSYLTENSIKVRVCNQQKPMGKYSQVQKSGEILILPLLISYFHDPNINQVLCSLMAAYIYDLIGSGKEVIRGAIGRWKAPDNILSIQGYKCRASSDEIHIEIDSIWTNCHSPQEIADAFLRRSNDPPEEEIVVGIIAAFMVGLDPLGNTDISDLTEAEILRRIRGFLSLSVDLQKDKARSTIPNIRVFNPATTTTQSQDGSYLQVAIPVELHSRICQAAHDMGLGSDSSEEHRVIAIAISA